MEHKNFYRSDQRIKPSHLAEWLLSRGLPIVNTSDAANLMRVDPAQVRISLAPARKRGEFISPARGIYIPVPLEYRGNGIVDPDEYVDFLMKAMGVEYCLASLSAAAAHGVAHQSPMVYQIATNKFVKNRTVTHVPLIFLTKKNLLEIPQKNLITSGRRIRVPTPAATMLMLASDIKQAGGSNNAATAIVELAEEFPDAIYELITCMDVFPLVAAKRVGWILDTFAPEVNTYALAEKVAERGGSISLLSPVGKKTGALSKRWNLRINREVDPDL